MPLGLCGIYQAKHFQAYLTNYQINIVSKEYGNKFIYGGPEKDKRIYLYMHNNHYDVITKMPGFFTCYYCHVCKKADEHQEEHRCPNACKCQPKIITKNFDEGVSNYFGLIKCTLLPPRGLFYPVLLHHG